MNANDPKLTDLLHRWNSIDPSPGFESRVRRRLAEPVPKREALGWLQPVSALAAIVLAALIASHPTPSPSGGVLGRGTITASYVQIISGDTP